MCLWRYGVPLDLCKKRQMELDYGTWIVRYAGQVAFDAA